MYTYLCGIYVLLVNIAGMYKISTADVQNVQTSMKGANSVPKPRVV